jgi:hypothetical protein
MELHNLFWPLNFITSQNTKHTVDMREPHAKRPLRRVGCRWEDNNKMEFKRIGCQDYSWTYTPQNAVWRRIPETIKINLRVL